MRASFNAQVRKREDAVGLAGDALESAFDFMESAFADGQEMVVFVNELAIDLPGFKKDEIHIELKNGYHFATYNVTMIQRDIPYETALAQCIESGDVAACAS